MSNKTKINRMKRAALLMVLVSLMMTGCEFKQNVYPIYTGTPTPKPTSTNTPEPTAAPTDTPLPTATAVPTETPIPTPIVTPTETPTPVPTEIPHEHAYVCVDRVESTCKVEGYELYECRSQNGTCDAPTKREVLPLSQEHVFDEWEVVKKETDEEEGLKQRRCAVCGLVEEEKIPVHEHEFVEVRRQDWTDVCPYCGEESHYVTTYWYECECGEKKVKHPEPPKHYCNIAEVNGKVYITGSVTVREYPTSDSEKLGSLANGKVVTCSSMYVPNGWYRVEYKSGKYGWVSGKYVSLSDPKAPAGAATPTPPITYTKLRKYTEADRPFQPRVGESVRLIEASPIYEKPDEESLVKNETIFPVGTILRLGELTSNGFYFVNYGRTEEEAVWGYVPVSVCGAHCPDAEHRFSYDASVDMIYCQYCGEHISSDKINEYSIYKEVSNVKGLYPIYEDCETCGQEYLFGYMVSFEYKGKTYYMGVTLDEPEVYYKDFVSKSEIDEALLHYSGRCK